MLGSLRRGSSSFKKRKTLASFSSCLFQSQAPESKTEPCPAFVLSLAGHRLAMLTPAMWLCAAASRVAQRGKTKSSNVWFFGPTSATKCQNKHKY